MAEHQVAIDGKSMCVSRGPNGTVHIISAFATQARLVLAAQAIPDKANEITAIPGLLAQLNLAGAVVTIDAMRCHRDIVDQKADYVLALKGNHPSATAQTAVGGPGGAHAHKHAQERTNRTL